MILVVDASVAVKWFAPEVLCDRAFGLITPGLSRVAPDLIFSEVGNALWLKMRRGEVSQEQGNLAISSLEGFFGRIVRSENLAGRALEIAKDLDHPVYDCFYLACAEEIRDGRMVTADSRFLTALEGTGYMRLAVHLADVVT